MKKHTLFEAIRLYGYIPVQMKRPGRAKGALGKPTWDAEAAILSKRRIAVVADDWQHAYAVSHEIAEHVWGFVHCKEMFCQQANILAEWLRHLDNPPRLGKDTRIALRVAKHGV